MGRKINMFKVGSEVSVYGTTGKVLDAVFLDLQGTGKECTAKDGTLCYHVQITDIDSEESQWIPEHEVSTLKKFEDDTFFDEDIQSPELLKRGYSMVAWSDGLPDRPDNMNLPPILTLLMAIQYDKEGFYGSSWKGKGEYRGIMANIDRKYDRLDKMTQDEIEGKIDSLLTIENMLEDGIAEINVGESKIDAIADLANYCLLYLTYVREKYPNVFAVWVKRNVPAYLSEKIPFIQSA